MSKSNKDAKDTRSQAMELYIAKIDEFATMLRTRQDEIDKLARFEREAKEIFQRAKDAVNEAREAEHNTVSLILKFIRPGTIDIMPLFDTMDDTDETVHGEKSTEWRKEPIDVLNLSAAATRALIDADVVLVGQLQDRILKGQEWADDLGISQGMAQAIEAKLHDYIEGRKSK